MAFINTCRGPHAIVAVITLYAEPHKLFHFSEWLNTPPQPAVLLRYWTPYPILISLPLPADLHLDLGQPRKNALAPLRVVCV